MPTEKKADTIEELQDSISRARVAITTDYRGMKMSDLTTLRRRLREANVELTVVKNTLATIAAERAGKPRLHDALNGPTAIAFGYGDEAEAARVITDYVRTARLSMTISGGLLGSDRVMSANDVNNLATLPGKDVLLAQVMGGMNAPLASFMGGLNALMGQFVWAIQARITQLEGGE
jgi:large subunit ribosomal protein L10